MPTKSPEVPETWKPFTKPEPDESLIHQDRETPPSSLVSKLAECMGAVDRVPKRGRNEFHKYDYATEADIVATVRQELAVRQVMLIPSVEAVTREPIGDKGTVLTTLIMSMAFRDGLTGESIVVPWIGCGSDREDKGVAKALTAAGKYFLLKTFLIPTGDDPEASVAVPQAAAANAPAAAPTAPSVPNGGDSARSLPPGAVVIVDVDIEQGDGKVRGWLRHSGMPNGGLGRDGIAMFEDGMVADALKLKESETPVVLDIRTSKTSGKTYIGGIKKAAVPKKTKTVDEPPPPLTDDDIPF